MLRSPRPRKCSPRQKPRAKARQSKLEAALAHLKTEADQFRDAQSTTRHLAKELAEVEQEILEEQKDDSVYAKTFKQVATARLKLAPIEERILNESAVQTQLAGLSGVKLAETKASILERRIEYGQSKSEFDSAARELARIRTELFQADKDWQEAAAALAQARKDEKDAEDDTRGGATIRTASTLKIKNSAEATAAARAAIAQAEKVIKAAERNDKNSKNQPRETKKTPDKKNK